ncbi:nitroreductase/quinone reductase family protein [Mycolicibacillus koreensis]|uniref:Uncharacterized protein n=1 Tax=Mycolicibacillus koreensis TaxID=1069220 RepID=A0A7I7SH62_9MYCO|nr:nitroreductase/quinone reductase family protein [Mycolicibacillus koreensis]OSC34328.1 hypothetical protein B8W67_07240 [Mycolicibacillus koreensis]BBY55325.1 hypothetical protein MKOR_25760 [Mycolicibacillus koreensis]
MSTPRRPHALGRALMRAAPLLNAPVMAVGNSRFGGVLDRTITRLTYTGRRSGRTVTIPVAYRRTGDTVVVGVNLPEAKTWWRNFTGPGAPLSLRLDGVDHPGHGVAERYADGRVQVVVTLSATG